jgi:hypothetical protein
MQKEVATTSSAVRLPACALTVTAEAAPGLDCGAYSHCRPSECKVQILHVLDLLYGPHRILDA